MRYSRVVLLLLLAAGLRAAGQNAPVLPVNYEELTSPQFVQAVTLSHGTCLVPLGILEKHGPHLPLGTDLIDVRKVALTAAAREYAVVFPPYYFGQINEARHQPGTVAYSHELVWNVLQETCDELARNGMKKIILVNGHGGNNNLLRYFCQVQMERRHGYAVLLFAPVEDEAFAGKIAALKKTQTGGHADEEETAMMLSHRPDLVHLDQANTQSGKDLARLGELPFFYTGIWWYARYPNHYAGDGGPAQAELGKLRIEHDVEQLVKMIACVKTDEKILQLQKEFYDHAEHPLETKPF
ncbi:MAG TPA: creatininase family protein [bacterium]|nr:creatininase family protein [bacterium]HQG45536.1 creatininase family protein [bacterium]HQI48227.1 creatininase family protein [bacterium]HQJ65109.1 creatininase family protein [bacterium]